MFALRVASLVSLFSQLSFAKPIVVPLDASRRGTFAEVLGKAAGSGPDDLPVVEFQPGLGFAGSFGGGELPGDDLSSQLHLSLQRPTEVPEPVVMQEVRANLADVRDMMYTTSVDLGTPPVRTRLIVDTGSSDTWVRSVPGLTQSSSLVAQQPQKPVDIKYGKGEMKGDNFHDRICLAELCLSNQSFIIASDVEDIGVSNFDGLLGLSFPSLQSGVAPTFLDHLASSGRFHKLAMGMALQNIKDSSYISFGEVGEIMAAASAETGSSFHVSMGLMVSRKTHQPIYWMTHASVKLDGHQRIPFFANFDTGTSLILVPAQAYVPTIKHLLSNARGDCSASVPQLPGMVVCPCDAEINPLTFRFENDPSLRPNEPLTLNLSLTSADLLKGPIGRTIFGDPVCFLSVMRMNTRLPMFILGDTFLRKVHMVFDYNGEKSKQFPAGAPSLMMFPRQSPPASTLQAGSSSMSNDLQVGSYGTATIAFWGVLFGSLAFFGAALLRLGLRPRTITRGLALEIGDGDVLTADGSGLYRRMEDSSMLLIA